MGISAAIATGLDVLADDRALATTRNDASITITLEDDLACRLPVRREIVRIDLLGRTRATDVSAALISGRASFISTNHILNFGHKPPFPTIALYRVVPKWRLSLCVSSDTH